MGNNLDLSQMLAAPEEITCPRCLRTVSTDLDDYDIDCGSPNPGPGEWLLRMSCPVCGHWWILEALVTFVIKEDAEVVETEEDP